MATWVQPIESETDPDAPLTAQLGKRWDNNAIAAFEGASGSPVNITGWHPYNMTNVDDGADGEIYDFATDGAVTSVVTPIFVDGYEYMVRWEDIISTGGVGFSINLSLFLETPSLYKLLATLSPSAGQSATGQMVVNMPRFSDYGHSITMGSSDSSATTVDDLAFYTSDSPTISKVSKARMSTTGSGSPVLSGGKVFLYKRREFITS